MVRALGFLRQMSPMLLQLGCMGFQNPSSTVQPVGETSAQTDAATQAQALALQLEAMQRQGADILEQVKAMSDRLSQLTVREAELRAVLEREAELQPHQERLMKVLGRERIAENVSAAIDRAELHLEPFPYTIIDGLLPAGLYKCLLKGIPPVELFRGRPGKQNLSVPFRLAPAYSNHVWRFMAEVLVPEVITPALIKKFRRSLDEWTTRNWPDLPPESVELHGSEGRVMLQGPGYRIRPHRDPKWGFVTGILYLGRDGDSEAWGTQVYAVDEDREATTTAPYWIDEKRCRLTRDVEYRPNRLLVFLNSTGAHGAHIPADVEPETLQRYIYQFRIGPTTQAISMLTSMLPEKRRPFWAGRTQVDY